MLAIIGGSGLNRFEGADLVRSHVLETAYGSPSSAVQELSWSGRQFLFMPRHGDGHRIPPHKINYRANLAALRQLGATGVIACNAVGAMAAEMPPGALVLPDQIIDYSWGREHTYCDGHTDAVLHVDFSHPFCNDLRARLVSAARLRQQPMVDGGVYACTQGPRLETAAEIRRLVRDGCDLVGMTMMPEAGLARELALPYASVCVVANWAAGISTELISMEDIHRVLAEAVGCLQSVLTGVLASSQ